MLTVTRSGFRTKLIEHDWYYAFSDDHRAYNRGRDSYYGLMDAAKALDCPWPLRVMGDYINGKVISKYFQPDPQQDQWYHQSVTDTRWAMSLQKIDLLSQEDYIKIESWFKEQ